MGSLPLGIIECFFKEAARYQLERPHVGSCMEFLTVVEQAQESLGRKLTDAEFETYVELLQRDLSMLHKRRQQHHSLTCDVVSRGVLKVQLLDAYAFMMELYRCSGRLAPASSADKGNGCDCSGRGGALFHNSTSTRQLLA